MDVVVHPLTHEVLVLTTLNIHNSRPFSLYPSIISFRSYQLSPSKQGMCDPWAHLTCTVEVASGFQVCNQYYIYKNKINTLIGLGLRTRVGKSDPFSIHLYVKNSRFKTSGGGNKSGRLSPSRVVTTACTGNILQ